MSAPAIPVVTIERDSVVGDVKRLNEAILEMLDVAFAGQLDPELLGEDLRGDLLGAVEKVNRVSLFLRLMLENDHGGAA